jgi:putative ABC transport system permease protein
MTWEIFLSAYNSIIANKIRSFLTIIGIVIGIASVIAISGLGEGSKKSVNDNLSKLGTNRITISTNYRSTITDKDRLNYSDEEFLRAYEEIVNISPVSNMSARYEVGTDYTEVSLKGVNSEAQLIENLEILDGEFFTSSQMKAKSNVVVIDDAFAKIVFKTEKLYLIKMEIVIMII